MARKKTQSVNAKRVRCLMLDGKRRRLNINVYTIGIVTDKMEYCEEELTVRKSELSYRMIDTLERFFSKYAFDSHTDICFSAGTTLENALPIYLTMLASFYRITVQHVQDSVIVWRLSGCHPEYFKKHWWKYWQDKSEDPQKFSHTKLSAGIVKKNFSILWKRLSSDMKCPWIDAKDYTVDFDYTKKWLATQRQRVRLGAYFLVCRRYLKIRKSKSV